ncbi:MAG: Gfo/Idh/MocA family oxidoreductase [Verrucomicrobiota bacterium]
MDNKLNWGIIGTGGIAHRFAKSLLQSKTGHLAAVGSRSESAAQKFAANHPCRSHGCYEALLADPEVKAVYISTPHPMHREWAIKAADAGKHILCEKPLAMNRTEAADMIEAARQNDVFLMEAFMYRCHPQTARLVELIRSGTIGEVRLIRATFSFSAEYDLKNRLFARDLGGGGILDVGCYCASMARLIAGAASGKAFEEPVEINGSGQIGAESGVDEYAVASLKFPGGILAQLATGVRLDLENNVRIVGTEGSILIPSPWTMDGSNGFLKMIIFKTGIPEEVVVESSRSIYAIEADHVAEQIPSRQSPLMSWDDSLGNMKTLDAWRSAVGG